jgi:redox-sensitive bicupin YhaK (pirin superfamily)
MLTIYKAGDMGRFKNDWLNARYHFSFGDYHNPRRMGFGPLRVINDDVIGAGTGFGMHPHKDMEIITFVREGGINHRDSLGNQGRTSAGDVQVMSAGTGITHAESADASADTKAFQIWIQPRAKGLPPRWEQAEFPKQAATDGLTLLISGRAADAGKGALSIYQDAAIYGGRLEKGATIVHTVNGQAYIVVSEGRITVNGQGLETGDGAEVTEERSLTIEALETTVLLVIEMDKDQRKAA